MIKDIQLFYYYNINLDILLKINIPFNFQEIVWTPLLNGWFLNVLRWTAFKLSPPVPAFSRLTPFHHFLSHSFTSTDFHSPSLLCIPLPHHAHPSLLPAFTTRHLNKSSSMDTPVWSHPSNCPSPLKIRRGWKLILDAKTHLHLEKVHHSYCTPPPPPLSSYIYILFNPHILTPLPLLTSSCNTPAPLLAPSHIPFSPQTPCISFWPFIYFSTKRCIYGPWI